MIPVDLVISYVNSDDDSWREDYIRDLNHSIDWKRYRDWGGLKYSLRGVEKNAEFIRNVYLLVDRDSQVPNYINRSRVNVVLHKEFIPNEFLPTYNSTTIELFMHRIPGLSNKFLYANDDMYIINKISLDDYLVGGLSKVKFSTKKLLDSSFNYHCRNSIKLLSKGGLMGLLSPQLMMLPEHSILMHDKRAHAKVLDLYSDQIRSSITRERSCKNYNQYLFLYYQLFNSDLLLAESVSPEFIYTTMSKVNDLELSSLEGTKVICINDSVTPDYSNASQMLSSEFEKYYPNSSKYELNNHR